MTDVADATEETPAIATAPPRPADCDAVENDAGDMIHCGRCGLQWDVTDAAPPPCEPMTFTRMRNRLCAEISAAESSMRIVGALRKDGLPASPHVERKRISELEALLRLYDRVTVDKRIHALLNEKK